MKSRVLGVLLLLALSATMVRLFENGKPRVSESSERSGAQEANLLEEVRLVVPLPSVEIPESELGLSFGIKFAGDQIFIKLVNQSERTFNFYNSMEIHTDRFPSAAGVRVRHKDGSLFLFKIEGEEFADHWTPLYLTSRAFLDSEHEIQTLKSGETLEKRVRLKNFFGGSSLHFEARDFEAQGFEAQCYSRVFLDNEFHQYIEAETGWFRLPKLKDIPPPADC